MFHHCKTIKYVSIVFLKSMVLMLLVLWNTNLLAQNNTKNNKSLFNLERLSIKAEYFGETLRHPGMAVGTDYAVVKNSWFALHWDSDLGFYIHRWNHVAAFIKTSLGTRYTTKDGVLFDFNIGVGYLHTFPDGDVYQKNNAGQLEKMPSGGYAHFMPAVSFLFGWDASKRTKIPLSIYFGPEAFIELPFNHGILPHAAVKIGIIYHLRKPSDAK